jgi:transcriptional regulator with XRE-family HTH domain
MNRNVPCPPQANEPIGAIRPGSPLVVFRVAKGLTQAQLAAAAGISTETVSNIERGVYRPLPLTARALAGALGCEPEELVPVNEQRGVG